MGEIIQLFNKDEFVTCEICETITNIDDARMDSEGEIWVCPKCFEHGSSSCDCENPIVQIGDEYPYCEECGRLTKEYFNEM